MTTLKCLKRAWIRNPDAPIGKPAPGHINCPCGNAPESNYKPGHDIYCTCGRRYTWDGAIKGTDSTQTTRNDDTLTAYKVILSGGHYFVTSMSAGTTLQDAYNYFIGRRINTDPMSDPTPQSPVCYDVQPLNS